MRTLKQYLGKLFTGHNRPSEPAAQHAIVPVELEREISAISGENQALAEEVQRVRTDFERARDEENRKIADLEQDRQAIERARNEDQRKLAELESFSSNFETARDADTRKVLDLEHGLAEIKSERSQARDEVRALENALAEAATRLEKSDQQIKDLQLNSVEHAKLLETSLSDASKRLESTENQLRELETRLVNDRQAMELARNEDQQKLARLESLNSTYETARDTDSKKILELEKRFSEVEAERKQVRDEVRSLEDSLAEASTRLTKSDLQIKDLQVSSVGQAKRLEASLSDASTRLDSTTSHVNELETRLVNDRQDYLKTYQEVQGRFRKQDSRMNWTTAAAGVVLLLGTAAAGVLIWNVQGNTMTLSDMSNDIKRLMGYMNVESSMEFSQLEEEQQLDLPFISPEDTRAVVTAEPTYDAAAVLDELTEDTEVISLPEPSVNATTSKADPRHTNFSALDPDRARSRGVLDQPSRKDAKTFFEENANVAGVVSLPSGAQYRVVKSGSGETPSLSDKVVVSYVGTKLDGTIFAETYSEGEPLTFNMKEVLPGWREALLTMEEGSEFELYLPPDLTKKSVRKRGKPGSEPNIFLIELLQVVKEDVTDPNAPAN